MNNNTTILLFYQYFSPILPEQSVQNLIQWQKEICETLHLTGRVLISEQGINGTLAGTNNHTKTYENHVETYQSLETQSLLFHTIQWKRSTAPNGQILPFPDLRVRRVKEIVSSGGTIAWDNANPIKGGTHLKPSAFHQVLEQATIDDNLVILDVRNRWEHSVGHFTDAVGRSAIHPNMRNFTQFKEYIDTKGPELFKNKKVLMYCTGGIRCETASAYLLSTGIAQEVCQLEGGIHTYCEERMSLDKKQEQEKEQEQVQEKEQEQVHEQEEEQKEKKTVVAKDKVNNYFLGSNFVFDRRAQLLGGSGIVVGKCTECKMEYDQFDGAAVCTACVCPVLVCGTCRETGIEEPFTQTNQDGFTRKEWFCQSHNYLAGSYYYCIDFFDSDECKRQKEALVDIMKKEIVIGVVGGKQSEVVKLKHWRDRKVVQRQINRLSERAKELKGLCDMDTLIKLRDSKSNPLCRCCGKEDCDGRCWGFWNTPKREGGGGV